MTGQYRTAPETASTPKRADDGDVMTQLSADLDAITKASSATPGCQVLAALICAARCARQAGMSAPVAAALLAEYIVRDEPD